jgi:GNAT superfamily N-acetyltransferase
MQRVTGPANHRPRSNVPVRPMSEAIEIRETVDPAERLAILALAHRATSASEPLAFYQARRLAVPRRAQAQWWLLAVGGRPASTLLCYPLQFAIGSERFAGYGLGAVATAPEYRQRGLASRLCTEVAEHSIAAGRPLGLLYSAIPPAFYERLGYREAPAWNAHCGELAELFDSGEAAELRPLEARRAQPELEAVYRAGHRGLHLHRDAEAWSTSLACNPRDVFFGLGAPLRGYARISADRSDALEVIELVLRDPGESLPVLRALAGLALELGRKRITGWFPCSEGLEAWFVDQGRGRTLPMVRGDAPLSGSQFWEADYF